MTLRTAVVALAVTATACGAPLMKLPSGAGAPAPDAAAAWSQATRACRAVRTLTAEIAVSGSVAVSFAEVLPPPKLVMRRSLPSRFDRYSRRPESSREVACSSSQRSGNGASKRT